MPNNRPGPNNRLGWKTLGKSIIVLGQIIVLGGIFAMIANPACYSFLAAHKHKAFEGLFHQKLTQNNFFCHVIGVNWADLRISKEKVFKIDNRPGPNKDFLGGKFFQN